MPKISSNPPIRTKNDGVMQRTTSSATGTSVVGPPAAAAINSQSQACAAINSQSQACAVCKYQRRKCSPTCPLAPFFPATNHKDFLNTRKLFGVRKITRLLESLQPQQRSIAMKSIIIHANMRAADPVGGCHRIISDLQTQINWYKAELQLVLQQLAICKAQAATTTTQRAQQQSGQPQMVDNDDEQDQANGIDPGLEDFNMYDNMPTKEGCGFRGLSPVYNVFSPNFVKVESEESIAPMHYKRDLLDVGEDIKPLLSEFDEKGEGAFPFDSKVSIHCSDKQMGKDEEGSIQHELKPDLKGAASLFTLTRRDSYEF